MTSCCLQKSEVKNYNEMQLHMGGRHFDLFPALGLFSRAVRSWQGGLLQVFPPFQPVTCFPALGTRGQFNKTFTSVTFVLGSENNSYTYKLHLSKFYYLTPGDLLQVFPPFQPVTFFPAWHYASFTNYKPMSDQSNVFQVTENCLQIFFICQC